MAVVIGSNLRKEIAGSLLFEGVSFSVERGDRLSLSGPNGAGKTTLLRMLAGETEVHGGELVFAQGPRLALHDQRPPLDSGLTLREYALSGARDLIDTEEELRRLEQAMAGGDHGQPTLRRYAEAQARLQHAGGYDWRDRAARGLRGRGLPQGGLEPPAGPFSGRLRQSRPRGPRAARTRLPRGRSRPAVGHLLGRRADARLARAGALRRPRPAAPRRADEPPRRREPRVARAGAAVARRRSHPRRARPLVPRGRDDRRARDRSRALPVLPRPLARVAPREGAPCRRGGQDRGARRHRHRPPRAVRRAVPLQEEQGQAGPGEADADREAAGGALVGGRRVRAADAA